ncbi:MULTISPECIES: SDR family NAD(P)-dependent oxidoreductase [Acinetobacter]|jgi:3-oxoacyl-[acyl-carrier protein] reductase/(S)-1-phenylethanol dehydrogenase|uniref:SDR family oxidoreductase n=1 Tax=Acinetobacter ursingii TaxID=108980 RepID=A0AA46PAH8_9GAMM|nr:MULTISPECIES: SDR family oxidoreductase [Acinetobacter]EXD29975.1 pyridoxal 4-dehydrogenase [Acinetobacter sp. 479375]MDN5542364.1 SDR family oxidoreductase [Acinetobacter sp.]MDN5556665.1 SDR family oxidoreductase [Acinetobacter sp.]UYF73730.1 SDR family oxidoreductase [Acinetobacter ursingii]
MSKGTAVITGAANGIGQAYAQRLAADGFDIAVADVVDAAATRQLVAAEGRKFFSAIVDVTSPESTQKFATEVAANMPPVAALVNNAGIYPWKSFEDTDYETWKKVISVNLDGAFLMSKAFVPVMKNNHFGRIVNVASTTFWLNAPEMTAYIASKGGVIGFTRALASEVGAFGINVNAIAPGLTNTKTMHGINADIFEYLPKQQAIPRMIEPQDIVGVVSFLCSTDSGFVTGQTIAADGGQVRI